MIEPLARFNVLGCMINQQDKYHALKAVDERIQSSEGGYVCLSNVHTVVTAYKDLELREITNNSFMSLPDGKPLSVYARLSGYKNVTQVAGPDFMEYLLKNLPSRNHYLYGSTESTLQKLRENILSKYPSVNIVGAYSPPFRPLSDLERNRVLKRIAETKPQVVWVGLGAPKQEYWMAKNYEELGPAILIGVGAAFDFLSGEVKRCPAWISDTGFEWLYRMLQEPRRLWKRYFVTNSLFFFYLFINMFSSLRTRK